MKKNQLIQTVLFVIIGIFAGAIIGFLYWQLFGYQKPPIWIVSTWVNDVVYGGLLGGLTGNIIRQGFFCHDEEELIQQKA